MNIPKYATPLYGLGAVSTNEDILNIDVSVKVVATGESCDFDISDNPEDIYEGASVCAPGFACDNGVCKEPGFESKLCQTNADCGEEFYCTNLGVCEALSIPPKNDEQDSEYPVCDERSTIERVQRLIGVEVDGKWGCDSQRALDNKGLWYGSINVSGECMGPHPNPCDYGQCVNGKCPTTAGTGGGSNTTGGNLVKVVDEQIIEQKEEESKTPWGWIIGGIALAAIAAGGGYYYYSTQKSKSPKVLKAKEPHNRSTRRGLKSRKNRE